MILSAGNASWSECLSMLVLWILINAVMLICFPHNASIYAHFISAGNASGKMIQEQGIIQVWNNYFTQKTIKFWFRF